MVFDSLLTVAPIVEGALCLVLMCGSRGGIGGPDPPEKSQKYRAF